VLVPATDYAIIEDVHGVIDHMLTEYFRKRLDREELVAG
jgi:hypothetical protein